jgi:hypothetical protein
MLSAPMIIVTILLGVVVARSLKYNRIMPDVEDFIVKTGLLGAFVGISLLQIVMTIFNNQALTVIGTAAMLYLGICAGYDVIENYYKHKSNKRDVFKSIIIG